ncbi:hypothetical protein DL93DRAFT_2107611 [Clavulina sp. PMI_390]|nr:hypothetical protein DL93DRAFT_2107611 [Clavulina sp. PMI_390]
MRRIVIPAPTSLRQTTSARSSPPPSVCETTAAPPSLVSLRSARATLISDRTTPDSSPPSQANARVDTVLKIANTSSSTAPDTPATVTSWEKMTRNDRWKPYSGCAKASPD